MKMFDFTTFELEFFPEWKQQFKIGKKIGEYNMAGAFHMYYVYEFLKRKWLYPEKIIDHTLRLQHANGLWDRNVTYCVDLDGIYCLTRSCRNANGYRSDEIKTAIERYLTTAEQIFNDQAINPTFNIWLDNLKHPPKLLTEVLKKKKNSYRSED